MKERLLMSTCVEGWRRGVPQKAGARASVERAAESTWMAFQQAEETLGSTQEDLSDIVLKYQEIRSKLVVSDARSTALEEEVQEKTARLQVAKEVERQLKIDLSLQTTRAEKLQLDAEHSLELRVADRARLQSGVEKHAKELETRDEQIAKLELDAHRKKMNYLALKRECEANSASLKSLEEMVTDKDKMIKRLEEELATLRREPDAISAIQAQLGQAEEDIFVSTLQARDMEGRPLVEELKFTRRELDIVAERLQQTEKTSLEQVDRSNIALAQAQQGLQMRNHLVVQNEANLVKVERVEGENSALQSRLEAMDVAYEELLAEVAVLSSSPFGQKVRRRDCDWRKTAAAFRLITTQGARISTRKVHAKELLRALRRNVRETLRADIVSVHDVKLDPGLRGAFDMLSEKGALTTLYWGAGPDVDPLRSDLMFWFLSQPWGTENAAHAHHLGAYVDGDRYRLVLVKAFVSERVLAEKQYQRVAFDPFTCVPMAIITYTTVVKPTGCTVAHPLSYLRYAKDWDEDATAKTLEEVARTMGMHGVNLVMAGATLHAPDVRTTAQSVWQRCKSRALKNACEQEVTDHARNGLLRGIIGKELHSAPLVV